MRSDPPSSEHAEVRSGSPITIHTAAQYLIAQGVLSPDVVLDGGITVTAMPRRNRNLIARIGDSDGLVIKQPEPATPGGTRSTLRTEADFYRYVRTAPEHQLSALTPEFVAYDDNTATLVLRLLTGHDTYAALCRDSPVQRFPISAWRALGEAMATIHHPGRPDDQRPPLVPAVFYAHRPALDALRTLSPAGLTVLKVVQSSAPISDSLAAAPQWWRAGAFIHGDIRLENLLFARPDDVRFIDWELSGVGDPTWDLACAVAELVRLWLREHTNAADADVHDTGSWAIFQAAIRSLWFGYSAGRTNSTVEVVTLSRFAALRLVQNAFEASATGSGPTPTTVLSLQIAENVLAEPAVAAETFFGLSTPDLI